MPICEEHTRYKGKRAPKTGCDICWREYIKRKHNMSHANADMTMSIIDEYLEVEEKRKLNLRKKLRPLNVEIDLRPHNSK